MVKSIHHLSFTCLAPHVCFFIVADRRGLTLTCHHANSARTEHTGHWAHTLSPSPSFLPSLSLPPPARRWGVQWWRPSLGAAVAPTWLLPWPERDLCPPLRHRRQLVHLMGTSVIWCFIFNIFTIDSLQKLVVMTLIITANHHQ